MPCKVELAVIMGASWHLQHRGEATVSAVEEHSVAPVLTFSSPDTRALP
jgi:hypothetical protein